MLDAFMETVMGLAKYDYDGKLLDQFGGMTLKSFNRAIRFQAI
jgi:hypothetical protein